MFNNILKNIDLFKYVTHIVIREIQEAFEDSLIGSFEKLWGRKEDRNNR